MKHKFLQLLFTLAVFAVKPVCGQHNFSVETYFGGNYTYVRNKVLNGERPAFGFHFGAGATFTPAAWKRYSFAVNVLVSKKGYMQYAGPEHNIKFMYLAFQLVTDYSLTELFSGYAGIDFSKLKDSNIEGALDTYHDQDFGIIIGFQIFKDRPLALNTQIVYGLTPILHYYNIDKIGNFTSEIKDIKNTCISFGLRYRILR